MIVGKPASGKSTLLEEVVLISRIKLHEPRVISDVKVLFDLCPKVKKSSEYHYEGDSLVLEDNCREKIMRRQFEKLGELWSSSVNDNEVLIMEVTHPRLDLMIGKYFSHFADQSCLICISCDKKMLYQRNNERPENEKVPDVYLNMFDNDDKKVFYGICRYFYKSVFISNNGKIEDLRQKAREINLDV